MPNGSKSTISVHEFLGRPTTYGLGVVVALASLWSMGPMFVGCSSSDSNGGASSTAGVSGANQAGSAGTSSAGTSGTGGAGAAGTAGTAGSSGTAGSGSGAPPVHFVVYGDSRSNVGDHQSVVDAFALKNPELVLATGDLWDGYGPDQWRTIISHNPNINDLLNNNLFMVSRGNHETVAEVQAFAPTLLRDNAEQYSFTRGNSFFVSLGMDPANAVSYLETQLSSGAATAADWRFVYSHYPIYSAGPHGGAGIAEIESLCDQYGVSVYFTGHDHLYERSHQMRAQQVVDTGDALQASKGTVYVVTGGGGAPLYDAGSIPSTHFTKSTLHFVDVHTTGASLTVEAFTPDGSKLDSFTISK